MAEPLPPSLAIPEVSRFVKRANQLRAIKPALAYWCEYHAVNQIVAKGLHNGDDAAFNFTKTLIDRLEATKNERATDDAIVDNTAGQAYVEQFANETFDRAERTLRANKVTRQTADTFDAAATFFDLGSEWGPLDAETLQKIKFAKWNAARILKAIREGKDPNDSNPKIEEPEEQAGESALDPDDPEVKELAALAARSVTMEEVPDAGDAAVPPEQFQPSPQASSAHEDYFPPAPSNAPETFAPSPMSESPAQPVSSMPPPPEPASSSAPYHSLPSSQVPQSTLQAPSANDASAPPSWATTPSAPTPQEPQQSVFAAPPSAAAWTSPVSQPAPPPLQQQAPPPVTYSVSSHKDLDKAQKHAKWAISALNFDDVPTAVQELRNALACLGAQ